MTAPGSATLPSLEARLAAVAAAAERDLRPTGEETRRVLENRARLLARPVESAQVAQDALELLVVTVDGARLAIPIDGVVAIARATTIAVLPRAIRPVYGVTAWRGRTLTVLSLAAVQPPVGADTRLVVLGSGARASLAVVVEDVEDVRSVARGTITGAPAGPRRSYARGMTPDGLLVVDGDALLHPELLAT